MECYKCYRDRENEVISIKNCGHLLQMPTL